MAISYLAIQHDTAYGVQGAYDIMYPDGKTSEKRQFARKLEKYISGLAGGSLFATVNATVIETTTTAAFASGTATITHANLTAGDTLVIGGVTFTARASGAVANEFNIGADATADAAALVVAINASTTNNLPQFISATSALGVVTITARLPGAVGNLITLSTNDATAYALSAATLTGGNTGTANGTTFSFGYGR